MVMGQFEREDLHAPLAEINTTPLVDVMLVLMVIFLVTAPVLNQAVKLELPHDKARQIDESQPIMVSVDAEGKYYWNDAPVSEKDLEQHLKSTADLNAKQQIYVKADANVAYSKVSYILATSVRFGLTNVGFVTSPTQ